jgi:uncharacterized protein involved in exopolysaccharide biosynthesis/Mrp family chromosome partitioning ATPase
MNWLFPILRPLFIRTYLSLKRYRAVAIVFFVATMGSTILFLVRQPREYASTATLELVWEFPRKVLPFDEASPNSGEIYLSFEEFRNTQVEFLRSQRLLSRVLDLLGIRAISPEVLKDRLIITPVPDSHLIRITVVDTVPERAKNLANAIADTYVDMRLEDRIRWIQRLVEWFQEELRTIREEASANEEELLEFQKKHRELTFTGDTMQLEAEIASLNQKYISAHTERMQKEGVYRAFQRYQEEGKITELLRAVPDNRSERLLVERTTLEGELSALRVNLGPLHPRVQEAERRLQAVDRELKEIGLDAVRRARMEWEVARSQEEFLYRQLKEKMDRALNQRSLWNEFTKKKRQIAMASELHHLLLERWKQVDLSRAFHTEQAIVVEPASLSARPFRPRVKFTLLLGFFIGSFGAILLVFFLNFLQQSFSSSDDLLALVGVRPIVEIPRVDWILPRTADELLKGEGVPSELQLLYQGVCQQLLYSSEIRRAQVLGTTSVYPQEGKSFNTILLGYTLATRFHQRTLLVDADPINPDLTRFFLGREPEPEFSSVLDSGRWENSLHSSPLPYLDFLPLGKMEITSSLVPVSFRAWEHFFSWARKEYTIVLLDIAPFSFYQSLYFPFKLLDLALVVVESERTSKSALLDLLENLKGKAPSLIILNRVAFPSSLSYGYGYGYGYEDSSRPSPAKPPFSSS